MWHFLCALCKNIDWWTLLHSNSCFLHICSRTEGKERKRKICGTNGLLLLLWLLWLKELIFFPKVTHIFPLYVLSFLWLKFLWKWNSTHPSKKPPRQLKSHQTAASWNTLQWCRPSVWHFHLVGDPNPRVYFWKWDLVCKLRLIPQSFFFFFFIAAILQPGSTVNKCNGMQD